MDEVDFDKLNVQSKIYREYGQTQLKYPQKNEHKQKSTLNIKNLELNIKHRTAVYKKSMKM